jgi:type II secretory pathway pseudopilin PulG
MKPKTYQFNKIVKMPYGKTAFTIIELLTVMSIIVILIGLLVPSLNMVKRYAKEVRQRAQFHSIDSALELFNGEWGGYPPSEAQDQLGVEYCGAMKLCEAMLGQDLMGFHPKSRFLQNATSDGGTDYIYATPTNGYNPTTDNLRARRIYLQQTTDAYRMWHLYNNSGDSFTAEGSENLYVLCDVYNRVKDTETGKGIGMPILYYKADTLGTIHDPCGTLPIVGDNKGYIYNYTDNAKLIELGLPPSGTSTDHPLSVPRKFYEITKDNRINIAAGRPYRPDSYILISAGFDGVYGTDDDIFNF